MTAAIKSTGIRLRKATGGQLNVRVTGIDYLAQAWFGVVFVRSSTPPSTWADAVEFYADGLVNWDRANFVTATTTTIDASKTLHAATIADSLAGDHVYLFIMNNAGFSVPDPAATFDALQPLGVLRA